MVMEPSGIVGGGRCMKQEGYIITIFREFLNGPLIFKIKKIEKEIPGPNALERR